MQKKTSILFPLAMFAAGCGPTIEAQESRAGRDEAGSSTPDQAVPEDAASEEPGVADQTLEMQSPVGLD